MTIYHIHHYVPKHAGGTDDPSNKIKVTVLEHANFHYERWLLTDDQFDYVAWLALSAQIDLSTAKKLAIINGGKKGGLSNAINKTGFCGRSSEKMSQDGKKAGAATLASKGYSFYKEMNRRAQLVLSTRDASFFKERSKNALEAIAAKRARGEMLESDLLRSQHMKDRYTRSKGYTNNGWLDHEDGKKMAKQNNAPSTCPCCGKVGQYRAMKRWHFDNCKQKLATT